MKKRNKLRTVIKFGAAALALALVIAIVALSLPSESVHGLLDVEALGDGLVEISASGGDWVFATDNASLELWFKPSTAEIRVVDKRSGKEYYSNAQHRDTDPLSRGTNRSAAESQLIIQYADDKNHLTEANSFDFAASIGQVKYYTLENGFKAVYLMRKAREEYLMPQALKKADLETLLDRFDARNKRKVSDSYRRVVYTNLSLDERAELSAMYPGLEQAGEVCILLDTVTNIKAKSIDKLFAEIGFTLDEKYALEGEIGVVHAPMLTFTASVEYRLDGDTLLATMPADELSVSESYRIVKAKLLPYFGAADSALDGYAFVPDGCGALIRFRDAARSAMQLTLPVYGTEAAKNVLIAGSDNLAASLPVFGIVSGDSAVFAMIEDGEALASISVALAGHVSSYNAVCAEFTIAANASIDLQALGDSVSVRMYQRTPYAGDCAVRFAFLSGDDANYSGMARVLRERYVSEGILTKRISGNQMPVVVELLMGITKREPVLGIPVRRVRALTSFEQAGEILDCVSDAGIERVMCVLSGWQEGGEYNALQTSVTPDTRVGDTGELRALANNAEIYLSFNATTMNSEADRALDGFLASRDAARDVKNEIVRLNAFKLSTQVADTSKSFNYLIKHALRESVASSYARSAGEYPLGTAVVNEGNLLYSDFDFSIGLDRDAACDFSARTLQTLASANPLMVNAPYGFALASASMLDELPTASGGHDIYDMDVPFYQMLVSGYIEYSCERINLMNMDDIALRLAEYGAVPSFKWMYEGDEHLRNSEWASLYSLNYRQWTDVAADISKRLSGALAPVRGYSISSHERADGVSVTNYENGYSVLVNYNTYTVTRMGVIIEPKSFVVIGG